MKRYVLVLSFTSTTHDKKENKVKTGLLNASPLSLFKYYFRFEFYKYIKIKS